MRPDGPATAGRLGRRAVCSERHGRGGGLRVQATTFSNRVLKMNDTFLRNKILSFAPHKVNLVSTYSTGVQFMNKAAGDCKVVRGALPVVGHIVLFHLIFTGCPERGKRRQILLYLLFLDQRFGIDTRQHYPEITCE